MSATSHATSDFGSIPAVGIVTDQQIARVKNVGQETFRAKYNNIWYEIHPDQEALVPWFAVCLWFGDPRAKNVGRKRSMQYRQKERERISTKWGVYHDPWWSDVPTTTTIFDPFNQRREVGEGEDYDLHEPTRKFRHPNLPECEVYDVTTGTRIYTVLDDPDGVHGSPAIQDSQDQIKLLENSMRSLQAQLQAVTMELNRRAPETAADIAGDAADADTPVTPPAPVEDIEAPTTVTPPKGSGKKTKNSNSAPAPSNSNNLIAEDGIA